VLESFDSPPQQVISCSGGLFLIAAGLGLEIDAGTVTTAATHASQEDT
jgi:hypothetical protein